MQNLVKRPITEFCNTAAAWHGGGAVAAAQPWRAAALRLPQPRCGRSAAVFLQPFRLPKKQFTKFSVITLTYHPESIACIRIFAIIRRYLQANFSLKELP